MHTKISVIIVNYKTKELLVRCLESLYDQSSFVKEVVVIDNDSQDGSVAAVRRHFPKVHLIASSENLGFGKANNLGLTHCTSNLLFLLNPDTTLLPGCFAAITEYMTAHPKIGMAGTAVYNENGALQSTVNFEYPGGHYAGTLFSDLPGEVAWLLGASLVVRKEVFERIQGFDPDFFLYGEDIDLGLRIRKANWALGYIPEAKIIHLEGQSERATPRPALFEKKMRAELLFYRKHYPPEIVRRIKRVRRFQAFWRMATLWLAGLLGRENDQMRAKRVKYSVAAKVYR